MERHLRERPEGRPVPRRPGPGAVDQLRRAAGQPLARAGARSSAAARATARCWRSRSRAAWRPGKRFVEALELHSHVANIGDVRSLVIHPAQHDAQPAHARGAAGLRRAPRPVRSERRHRDDRRHPRRPRQGLRGSEVLSCMPETFPALRTVVLDATEARALAEFYRQLLGYVYRPGDEPPPPGSRTRRARTGSCSGIGPARRASRCSRSASCRRRRGRTRRSPSNSTST